MTFDYHIPITPERLSDFISEAQCRFPMLRCESIGKSILGRDISCLRLGQGKSASLFVGAHHGAEAITSLILLKFIADISESAKNPSHHLIGFDTAKILRHRMLYIVPMLNPDGVAIAGSGADAAGILKERVRSMNGSDDFTLWQANARGVDLNHNYDAEFAKCKKAEEAQGIFSGGPTRYGGSYPESEPESHALAELTRSLVPELRIVLALHTQGEEIYRDFMGYLPKSASMLSECFANVSGYRIAEPPAEASYGGFKDYVIDAFDIPAFTIECGKGKNPLPPSDFDGIYRKTLPILLTAAAFA